VEPWRSAATTLREIEKSVRGMTAPVFAGAAAARQKGVQTLRLSLLYTLAVKALWVLL
jgi:hypothetical protein